MRQPILIFFTTLCLFLSSFTLRAGEGMWLPILLKSLNEAEMQSMGMQISAEDIYSVNKGSLKDAIVHFGGFCTGEVISDQGLLLTNHHCGYGQIQQHSSLENNLLEDGFWAKTFADEKPNPGLFVTFIVRMEDVSEAALEGVERGMGEADRQSQIDKNLAKIKEKAKRKKHQDVMIKPFYSGNQYYLFVTETYNDVRLVGAPPSSIGKFGADTDNWEWPRHTGDFSLFRIYTAPDGKPADYSEDNVPMKPRYHLPVSTQGVKEGDFTMVFGFPGRTDQYLPEVAVAQRTEIINPIRINMRDSSLAVIDGAMRQDPEVKIMYASKQARIANAWKKWIGESEGVAKTGGLLKKQKLERQFNERMNLDEGYRQRYGEILPGLNTVYADRRPYAETQAYVGELNYNIDLFRISNILGRLPRIYEESGEKGLIDYAPRVLSYLQGFYKNYRPEIDEMVAQKLIPIYLDNVREEHRSRYANDQVEFAGSRRQLITDLYDRSYLTKAGQVLELLEKDPVAFVKQLEGDPGYLFVRNLNEENDQVVRTKYQEYNDYLATLQREYMAALIELFPKRRFYPDANSTMRVSYGQVEGYQAFDSTQQHYQTYLGGVIDKYQPGDYEFELPDRLLQLHNDKDYGRWADETGDVPVCLLASNHTTGGNSGSPAINGKGELVGLNFDRVWEGTMSDINYDRSICRNIMVDIRYVMFLIEKLGGAGHLIEELELR
ncbi:serine protease [Lewinellaceae bacterium SD302]|nr:serine protease [Lewinellaceae bacterium SD302]